MHHNRFAHHPEPPPVPTTTKDVPVAGAFMFCPVVLVQGYMAQPCLWLAAYQRAYECAQAVVRPSRLERLHAVSWN